MKPDLPPPDPRAELEAKITALLLGELSAAEAANVMELIAHDAELAKLRDQLMLTLDLLRETAATPVGQTPAQPAPLRMSQGKREKLLAHFKTIRPEEFETKPRSQVRPLLMLAAVLMICGVLAALLFPARSVSKSNASRRMFSMHFDSTSEDRETEAARISPKPKPALAPASENSYNGVIAANRQGDQVIQNKSPHPMLEQRQIVLPQNTPAGDTTFALQNQDASQLQHTVESGLPSIPSNGNRNEVVSSDSATVANFDRLDDGSMQSHAQAHALKESQAESEGIPPGSPQAAPVVMAENGIASPAPEAAPASVSPPALTTESSAGAISSIANPSGQFPGAPADVAPPMKHKMYGEPSAVTPVAGAAPPSKSGAFGGGFAFQDKSADVNGNWQLGVTDSYAVNQNGDFSNSFTVPRVTNFSSTNGVIVFFNTSNAGTAPATTSRPVAIQLDDGGIAVGGAFDAKKDSEEIEGKDLPASGLRRLLWTPQPEVLTRNNAFTTFSLNVSDVAFHLAEASLKDGRMPDPASMRSEEFINAFDYRDPEPPPGAPIGFAWERAGDPFAHNRDFLRFSIKAAATGRAAGRPLNLVLLLDKSGSMERADRVAIIAEALKVLASQLGPNDTLSVVVFARTAHLIVDGVSASEAAAVFEKLRAMTPQGGTNLEEAMRLAYLAAFRHYLPHGENRVVLLTDGAANLGNVDPKALKQKVEGNRKQGVALDCFGVGLDGYNDEMLETLSRAGNGRYGFLNTPEEAGTEFAGKLAGALRVAAADVKVQVEFNPRRVTAYRQIGYAKDQLQTQDFRDNNVKAAQIGAAESGNALYTIEVNPTGEGDIGTVRVRFHAPGSDDYQEREWAVPYTGTSAALDKASPALRLCATAASFAEWLAGSPYASEVTPGQLLNYLNGVPQVYGADKRPGQLQWMIRQAKSISGK